MKMKMLLALVLLSGIGAGVVHADNDSIMAPAGRRGVDVHPLYGGYKVTRISSTSDTLVCSGRCVLGGLYMSTGPNASVVLIRDSGTADGTISKATRMTPTIPFSPDNTAARGNKIEAAIRTSNGIVVRLSAASTDEEAYVLFIDGDE